MCLAMPAIVTRILNDQKAIVNLGGIEKEISTALLESVDVGHYVIIHVGYAITKLDENEAKKTLQLFYDMLKQEK